MSIASVPFARFRRQLAGPGLVLACGPFNIRIRSRLDAVIDGLYRMYADFEPVDGAAFVDFEVCVAAPSRLRSFLRPQAAFFCDGREPFRPVPRAQAFAMLEWGLNWVVSTHAHDHLILHAAVLARGDRALLLAGDPGSGKSTLCAALMHDGWRLLSDELALLDLRTHTLRALARPVSLKNESIDVIRAVVGGARLSAVCPATTKGAVAHVRPDANSVRRREAASRPAWLVFPRFSRRAAGTVLEPVGRARAMVEMVRHGFNYGLLGADGFDALARLVDRCEIFRAEYDRLDEIVPRLGRLASFPAVTAGNGARPRRVPA